MKIVKLTLQKSKKRSVKSGIIKSVKIPSQHLMAIENLMEMILVSTLNVTIFQRNQPH